MGSNVQRLSHLSFPAALPKPSPQNMQWSEDGQLFILSRNAIHILTPELHMDPTLFSSLNPQLSSTGGTSEEVKWHTNLIEIDKKLHHSWALASDDWGALSLGSLDVSWVAMAPSPANSSKFSGCVVAALTSNLEVSLWGPSKNHIGGEWQKVQDVTQTIKDSVMSHYDGVQYVLGAQFHCLAWSRNIHIVSSEYFFDGSVLALGNRAGGIVCMQHSRETGLSYIMDIQIAEDWILDITWSPWSRRDDGHHSAYIVCSAADGSIYHVQMKVSLDSQELKIEPIGTTNLHPADYTPTTALFLIANEDYIPILFYAKPGIFYLQRVPRGSQSGWQGSLTFNISSQSSVPKQDPFTAIAGVAFYRSENSIQVYASDGTIYRVSDVMGSPKISSDARLLELSNEIQNFRFSKDEFDKAGLDDRIYVSAIIDYDHMGTLGWFYDCRQPNNFSHKLDSQHIGSFMLIRIQKPDWKQHFSSASPNDTVTYKSTSFKLRDLLLYLRDSSSNHTETNPILLSFQKPILTSPETLTHITNTQSSLFFKLFRDPNLSLLRLRLTLTLFISHYQPDNPVTRQSLDQITQSIKNLYMRFVLQHFQPVESLQDDDMYFLLRWVILCHNIGELQQEAMSTATTFGIREELSPGNEKVCEVCPACHVTIPINSSDEAVCENGHRWQRCSVTSFILATPYVRICVQCRRKSLLPASLKLLSDMENQDWLPVASQSAFMNELLEAVHWCLYCGGRFIRIL